MTDPYFTLRFGEKYSLILPGSREPDMIVKLYGGAVADPRFRVDVLTEGYLRTDELAQKGYPPVLTEEVPGRSALNQPDSPQYAAIVTNYGLPPNPEVVPVVVEKPNWQLLGRITVGVADSPSPPYVLRGYGAAGTPIKGVAVPLFVLPRAFAVVHRYLSKGDGSDGKPFDVLAIYRIVQKNEPIPKGIETDRIATIDCDPQAVELGIFNTPDQKPGLLVSRNGLHLEAKDAMGKKVYKSLIRNPGGLKVKIKPLTDGLYGEVHVTAPYGILSPGNGVKITREDGTIQIELVEVKPVDDIFDFPKGAYVRVLSG